MLGAGRWLSTDSVEYMMLHPLKFSKKHKVSLFPSLMCRSLKWITELFNCLIRIQTHDRDFNFHKHKIMPWLLWQWIAPSAAVWLCCAQDDNKTQCTALASCWQHLGALRRKQACTGPWGVIDIHINIHCSGGAQWAAISQYAFLV